MVITRRHIKPCVNLFSSRLRLKYFLLSLITIIFTNALFPVYAQDNANTSAANHRSIIKQFFEQQAKVRYVYSTTLNPSGTSIAWNVD
ncbi:MAG: hypothetical protein ABUT20_07655, partial [Bacteroidota bacterium]